MSDQYLDQSTIGELATAALRLIGAVASGETATADQLADAVKAANRMLAGWSNRRTLTLSPVTVPLVVVAGQTSYPIAGLMRVDNATDGALGYAFDTVDTSVDAPGPATGGALAYAGPVLAFTQALTPPGLTMSLYGDASYWLGRTILLYGPPRVPQFKKTTDPVQMPDGWDEAIVFNLAKRIAPEYGASATAEIIEGARVSLKNISALTTPRVTANPDPLFAMQSGRRVCGPAAGYRGF